MPVIKSKIDASSQVFKANQEAMLAQVADLKSTCDKIALGGSEGAREKHLARGKLLPRQRIEALLDEGSAFLELSQLAAYGQYDDGDLRYSAGRQLCLVIENPAKMLAVGKNFILLGQKGAAGVHQVNTRQPVFQRDFLGA